MTTHVVFPGYTLYMHMNVYRNTIAVVLHMKTMFFMCFPHVEKRADALFYRKKHVFHMFEQMCVFSCAAQLPVYTYPRFDF